MRVGNVAETVTVTGETPTVDMQSATQQRVIDHAVIDALPTARDSFAVGGLIPGTTVKDAFGAVTDVGGALGPSTYNLIIHGGKTEDQRLTMNGVSLSTMIGGGWGGGAIPNPSGFSEVTIDTAAVSARNWRRAASGSISSPRTAATRSRARSSAASPTNRDAERAFHARGGHFEPIQAKHGEARIRTSIRASADRSSETAPWFYVSARARAGGHLRSRDVSTTRTRTTRTPGRWITT